MKWPYIAYSAAWVATGAAVCVAVIVTRRVSPMWFFLLPMLISVGGAKSKEDTQNEQANTSND